MINPIRIQEEATNCKGRRTGGRLRPRRADARSGSESVRFFKGVQLVRVRAAELGYVLVVTPPGASLGLSGIWGSMGGPRLRGRLRKRVPRTPCKIWATCDTIRRMMSTPPADFKSRNLVMQHLVRELLLLREHNQRFRESDPQDNLLLFAEGAVTLLVLEHFLRIVVPGGKGSLPDLLQQAVSEELLRVENVKKICKTIGSIRGALAHGNYQSRAQQLKMDVATYFRERFAKEIEEIYTFTDYLTRQIHTLTGKPILDVALNPQATPSEPAISRRRRRKRPRPG